MGVSPAHSDLHEGRGRLHPLAEGVVPGPGGRVRPEHLEEVLLGPLLLLTGVRGANGRQRFGDRAIGAEEGAPVGVSGREEAKAYLVHGGGAAEVAAQAGEVVRDLGEPLGGGAGEGGVGQGEELLAGVGVLRLGRDADAGKLVGICVWIQENKLIFVRTG